MEIMICENMVKTNSSIVGYILNVNLFAILEDTSASSNMETSKNNICTNYHQPRAPAPESCPDEESFDFFGGKR